MALLPEPTQVCSEIVVRREERIEHGALEHSLDEFDSYMLLKCRTTNQRRVLCCFKSIFNDIFTNSLNPVSILVLWNCMQLREIKCLD